MSILTFLITLLMFNESQSLLIYDTVTVKVEDYGILAIDNEMLDWDMFYKNYGGLIGCDDRKMGNRNTRTVRCDIGLIAFSYSANKPVPDIRHIFPGKLWYDRAYVIKNVPADYTRGSQFFMQLSDDSNYAIYEPNCLKTTVLVTRPMLNLCLEFTINEFHMELLRKDDYEYYRFQWCSGVQMETVGKTFIGKNDVIKAQSQFRFRKVTLCDTDYYGVTCWYLCKNNERRKCLCDKRSPKSIDACKIKCNSGWIFTNVLYQLSNSSYLMRDCIIMNLCFQNSECRLMNKDCFQFDNTTKHCYDINLEYSRLVNLTEYVLVKSNILFYLDIILVNLTTFPHEYLKSNYSLRLNVNSLPFQRRIFKYIGGYHLPAFRVNSENFIDEELTVVVLGNWLSFNTDIKKLKVFRIFVRPTELKLMDAANNSVLGKYIYHGQSLKCLSNSKPLYRTVIMWKSHLTKDYFKEIITINETVTIQTYILYCEASLIISPTDPVIKYGYPFKVSIRPYMSFGWNVTDNVLTTDTVVACKSHDYVKGRLQTIQLEGYSDITEQIILHFYYSIGGRYKFICIWSNRVGVVVIRTLDFRLRTRPYEVCLFLFPSTPGGLIQCYHNGQLNDEYEVDVRLVIRSTDGDKNIMGKEIVRLPYSYDYNEIDIYCKVINVFNQLDFIEYEKNFAIYRQSTHSYIMTREYKVCPSYTNYVEKPVVVEYGDNVVILAHQIYYLAMPSNNELYYIVIYLALLGIFDIMAIIVSRMLLESSSSHAVISMNSQRIKNMMMRKFNDHINKIVSNMLLAPETHPNFEMMKFTSNLS